MRLGIFDHGWWESASISQQYEIVRLPIAGNPDGNAYAADLAGRTANGTAVVTSLANRPVDLLLDNSGTGLGFVADGTSDDGLSLAHERAGRQLCSHFVDPLPTAFQGLPWPVTWQSLQSRSWVKAVWDRAHAVELQRFGVPSVVHLPMAAPNRCYNTDPLDPSCCQPIVSFVGGQNTTYFAANTNIPSRTLLPGTLAQAIQTDMRDVSFYDVYHDTYGLGEPVTDADDLDQRAAKASAYFNAKLYYHAALCLRQRDRFVIFLKRKLGDAFRLIGSRWRETYGFAAEPPLPTADAYFNHFRETAINLNLVNGNAETGLNMRHFEITAAGGFMLCYDHPELEQDFAVGEECVVFNSEADLLEKIRHYLSHPEERVAIALAGQRRTLSEHLYSHRLEKLVRLARSQPPTAQLPVEYSKTTWREDFHAVVPEPDVVLDCGANVGQMATGLRGLYPDATIYSFEPVASLFEELGKRCSELRVHAVKKAVGDRDGRAMINLTENREANSLLGYQEGNPCAQWTRVIGREEIEVCTLDRWCTANNIDPQRVDIIKLDVQGAELKALYGARGLLRTTKLVYLEVSFVPIYKDSPLLGEIEAFLTECGYRRHAIYPSDQPRNWGDALYVKT